MATDPAIPWSSQQPKTSSPKSPKNPSHRELPSDGKTKWRRLRMQKPCEDQWQRYFDCQRDLHDKVNKNTLDAASIANCRELWNFYKKCEHKYNLQRLMMVLNRID